MDKEIKCRKIKNLNTIKKNLFFMIVFGKFFKVIFNRLRYLIFLQSNLFAHLHPCTILYISFNFFNLINIFMHFNCLNFNSMRHLMAFNLHFQSLQFQPFFYKKKVFSLSQIISFLFFFRIVPMILR